MSTIECHEKLSRRVSSMLVNDLACCSQNNSRPAVSPDQVRWASRSSMLSKEQSSVKRRSSARKSNYSLLIGTVEDEVSHMFGDFQVQM